MQSTRLLKDLTSSWRIPPTRMPQTLMCNSIEAMEVLLRRPTTWNLVLTTPLLLFSLLQTFLLCLKLLRRILFTRLTTIYPQQMIKPLLCNRDPMFLACLLYSNSGQEHPLRSNIRRRLCNQRCRLRRRSKSSPLHRG